MLNDKVKESRGRFDPNSKTNEIFFVQKLFKVFSTPSVSSPSDQNADTTLNGDTNVVGVATTKTKKTTKTKFEFEKKTKGTGTEKTNLPRFSIHRSLNKIATARETLEDLTEKRSCVGGYAGTYGFGGEGEKYTGNRNETYQNLTVTYETYRLQNKYKQKRYPKSKNFLLSRVTKSL